MTLALALAFNFIATIVQVMQTRTVASVVSGVVECSVVGALFAAPSAHEVCGEEFAVLTNSRGRITLGEAHAIVAMSTTFGELIAGYRRLIHFRRCSN